MGLTHLRQGVGVFLGVAMFATSPFVFAAEEEEESASPRRIEEVTVTAERREASISDTSISITAFTAEAIEDFGIRNQEDLQAMVPAAVIEPYDMAIRGVGRNFRSLGGDPGIATYQNGVYSEDFGIASTEGGLFDVERIEFLRGPQGTLYGRNAIGGPSTSSTSVRRRISLVKYGRWSATTTFWRLTGSFRDRSSRMC